MTLHAVPTCNTQTLSRSVPSAPKRNDDICIPAHSSPNLTNAQVKCCLRAGSSRAQAPHHADETSVAGAWKVAGLGLLGARSNACDGCFDWNRRPGWRGRRGLWRRTHGFASGHQREEHGGRHLSSGRCQLAHEDYAHRGFGSLLCAMWSTACKQAPLPASMKPISSPNRLLVPYQTRTSHSQ
jgi:hypothetical protein